MMYVGILSRDSIHVILSIRTDGITKSVMWWTEGRFLQRFRSPGVRERRSIEKDVGVADIYAGCGP